MSFRLTLVTALLGLSLLHSVFGFNPGFPYGSEKVRGVNLGGWLALEVVLFHNLLPASCALTCR